jgi:molecular chaperone IbpA
LGDLFAVPGLFARGSASLPHPLIDKCCSQEDMIMRSNFDLSPYRRSTVGFDRLFDFLESAGRSEQTDNYPPYDIEKLSDDSYRITLAVAGFSPADIDITARQNMLIVTGRKAENRNKDGNYLHMGIATRAFERRFELADFVRVEGADMKDGLLSIELLREIPEAMKPRKVEINAGSSRTIEGKDETPAEADARETETA